MRNYLIILNLLFLATPVFGVRDNKGNEFNEAHKVNFWQKNEVAESGILEGPRDLVVNSNGCDFVSGYYRRKLLMIVERMDGHVARNEESKRILRRTLRLMGGTSVNRPLKEYEL